MNMSFINCKILTNEQETELASLLDSDVSFEVKIASITILLDELINDISDGDLLMDSLDDYGKSIIDPILNRRRYMPVDLIIMPT